MKLFDWLFLLCIATIATIAIVYKPLPTVSCARCGCLVDKKLAHKVTMIPCGINMDTNYLYFCRRDMPPYDEMLQGTFYRHVEKVEVDPTNGKIVGEK